MSNKQILKNMKNQKKQTAVEWLEQEMLKPDLSMKEILKQAKEMEKEQIMDVYWDGGQDVPTHQNTIEIIEKLEQVLEEQDDSENVQMIIREAIHALKRAHIFAHRIDWYLAGDDGEESLYKRLAEELEQL